MSKPRGFKSLPLRLVSAVKNTTATYQFTRSREVIPGGDCWVLRGRSPRTRSGPEGSSLKWFLLGVAGLPGRSYSVAVALSAGKTLKASRQRLAFLLYPAFNLAPLIFLRYAQIYDPSGNAAHHKKNYSTPGPVAVRPQFVARSSCGNHFGYAMDRISSDYTTYYPDHK